MLEILIKGEKLDIFNSDFEITYTNIRFSEAVNDPFSTDLKLPQSDRNIRLLGVYGLFERGRIFQEMIDCLLVVGGEPHDAYLHVTSFSEKEIGVTVYVRAIPKKVYDKKVSDYFPKDSNTTTIFGWGRNTTIPTNPTNDIDFYRYDYNDRYYSNISAQIHPSVRLSKILNQIEINENISLPTVDNDLFVMANKKNVCPQNKYQVLQSYSEGVANVVANVDIPLVGGQHITNDLKTDWSYDCIKWHQSYQSVNHNATLKRWLNKSHKEKLTYNRNTKVTFKVYSTCDRSTTMQIRLYVNGVDVTSTYVMMATPVHQLSTTPGNVENLLSFAAYNVNLRAGDEVSFRYIFTSAGAIAGDKIYTTIIMEHNDYEITDDDYSVDLCYIGHYYGMGYATHNNQTDIEGYLTSSIPIYAKGPSPLQYAYAYFGVWCNMSFTSTVRKLLTDICWIHDKKLTIDRGDVIFDNPYSIKVVDVCTIQEMKTSTDKLAKDNHVVYKDNVSQYWFVDNEFLDDEKDIHVSDFHTSYNKYGIAILNQYEFKDEMYEDIDVVKNINVDFNDVGLSLFKFINQHLEHAPQLTKYKLDDITNIMVVEMETYENVIGYDYLYYQGKKFLVVDSTVNKDGLNNVTMIAIPTKFSGECQPPTITYNITTYVDGMEIRYYISDNTDSGMFECYVNDTDYELVTNQNATLYVDNLVSNTEYVVYFGGSNGCGGIDEKENVRTKMMLPSLRMTIGQIGRTRAVATLQVLGDYDVDNLALSISDGQGSWVDVPIQQNRYQFATLANLTPNTTYTVEFTGDFGQTELLVNDTFKTLPNESLPIISIDKVENITASGAELIIGWNYDNENGN